MTIAVQAIYEMACRKQRSRCHFAEHEKVEVVVRSPVEVQAAVEAVTRTYCLLSGVIRKLTGATSLLTAEATLWQRLESLLISPWSSLRFARLASSGFDVSRSFGGGLHRL